MNALRQLALSGIIVWSLFLPACSEPEGKDEKVRIVDVTPEGLPGRKQLMARKFTLTRESSIELIPSPSLSANASSQPVMFPRFSGNLYAIGSEPTEYGHHLLADLKSMSANVSGDLLTPLLSTEGFAADRFPNLVVSVLSLKHREGNNYDGEFGIHVRGKVVKSTAAVEILVADSTITLTSTIPLPIPSSTTGTSTLQSYFGNPATLALTLTGQAASENLEPVPAPRDSRSIPAAPPLSTTRESQSPPNAGSGTQDTTATGRLALFEHLDTNQDDSVSTGEAGDQWSKIQANDRNGDGTITREEFTSARTFIKGPTALPPSSPANGSETKPTIPTQTGAPGKAPLPKGTE